MTPQRFEKLKAALAKRQADLTVLIEGVHKPHNVAAISRSCDASGVLKLHAVAEKGTFSRRPKASAGSRRWVNTKRHNDSAQAFDTLRAQGMQLVIADPGRESPSFTDYDYTQPTAIVFGAELEGISDYARQNADAAIHIPMFGLCESLNVSVSAALVLFEAKRQREKAGMYDQCRLDEATQQRTLFEWCWPQLAHYCRMKQLAYPRINLSSGEVLDPIPGSTSQPWPK